MHPRMYVILCMHVRMPIRDETCKPLDTSHYGRHFTLTLLHVGLFFLFFLFLDLARSKNIIKIKNIKNIERFSTRMAVHEICTMDGHCDIRSLRHPLGNVSVGSLQGPLCSSTHNVSSQLRANHRLHGTNDTNRICNNKQRGG